MEEYWCCWVASIWLEGEEEEEDGEVEGGGVGAGGRGVGAGERGVGAGGRGVSLIIGEELLLWGDLVRVACMGVMKLDCWWWWCE